jgi:hypothetical protein
MKRGEIRGSAARWHPHVVAGKRLTNRVAPFWTKAENILQVMQAASEIVNREDKGVKLGRVFVRQYVRSSMSAADCDGSLTLGSVTPGVAA